MQSLQKLCSSLSSWLPVLLWAPGREEGCGLKCSPALLAKPWAQTPLLSSTERRFLVMALAPGARLALAGARWGCFSRCALHGEVSPSVCELGPLLLDYVQEPQVSSLKWIAVISVGFPVMDSTQPGWVLWDGAWPLAILLSPVVELTLPPPPVHGGTCVRACVYTHTHTQICLGFLQNTFKVFRKN